MATKSRATKTAKVATAAMVGRRLAEGRLPDGFTARDVVRKGWSNITTSLQAETAQQAQAQLLQVIRTLGKTENIDARGGEFGPVRPLGATAPPGVAAHRASDRPGTGGGTGRMAGRRRDGGRPERG